MTKNEEWIEYANEADLLNYIIFNCSAKEWKTANPELAKKGKNMRDLGSTNELIVLGNIESQNSQFIKQGLDKKTRFKLLKIMAESQLEVFNKQDLEKSKKKEIKDTDQKQLLNLDKDNKDEEDKNK